MLVIAESSGKQYKLEEGKVVEIDSFDGSSENSLFSKVLFCINENGVVDPSTVKISAKILGDGKRKKVIAFKKQRRTSCFEKRRGYRAVYTSVLVKKISC